jgi:predicted transcriptional regulator
VWPSALKKCGPSAALLLRSIRFYLNEKSGLHDHIVDGPDGKKWLEVTQPWLSKRLNLSERNIRRLLQKLRENDFLAVIEIGKANIYRPLVDGEKSPIIEDKIEDNIEDRIEDKYASKSTALSDSEPVDHLEKNDISCPPVLDDDSVLNFNTYLSREIRHLVDMGQNVTPQALDKILLLSKQNCHLSANSVLIPGVENSDSQNGSFPRVEDGELRTKLRTKCPQYTYTKINSFSALQAEKKNDLEKTPKAASAFEVPPQPCGGGEALKPTPRASPSTTGEGFEVFRSELRRWVSDSEYAAWLERTAFFRDPQGVILRFDSWFMADHVATKLGQTIADAAGAAGELGVLFQGPPGDVERARRPRCWVRPDGEPQEVRIDGMVRSLEEKLKLIRGVPTDEE